MIGKFGSDQQQLADLGGGVISEDGATLLSGESTGEASLLFGPAALREIQAGVANGDFSIPPSDATGAITADNPLPYWTLTNTTSTVTIQSSASAASGNVLQFVQLGVGASAILSRYVAIPGALDRSFSFYLEVYLDSYTAGLLTVRYAWAKSDFTATGTGGLSTGLSFGAQSVSVGGVAPSDASFMYVSVESGTAAHAFSISEIRINMGKQALYITDSNPATTPAKVTSTSGVLAITPASSVQINGTLIGAGVTTDLHHGITLQRTTNLTVNTSLDASATAITWSSAVKNTSLYAYWSSGSTIAIPLTGWYSITCHFISGTGLGTGFAFRLYALVNGTVIAETETQAGANTTSDTFAISTIAYMTAADSLVFRASASASSKTIGGSRRSACSVVYLGNTSA